MTSQNEASRIPVEPKMSLLRFLQWVRARPGMYLMNRSAQTLADTISGWKYASTFLGQHDAIYEQFESWLDERYGNVGELHALQRTIDESGEARALAWFFSSLDEYLAIHPEYRDRI